METKSLGSEGWIREEERHGGKKAGGMKASDGIKKDRTVKERLERI